MPAPIPVPVRRAIWRRHLRGQAPAAIAANLGLASRTVRHLLRCWQRHGPEALAPRYAGAGRPLSPEAAALRDRARQLRREHPTWGAGLLRLVLRREHPGAAVPCERTVRRWLDSADLAPAPVGRRPASGKPLDRVAIHRTRQRHRPRRRAPRRLASGRCRARPPEVGAARQLAAGRR